MDPLARLAKVLAGAGIAEVTNVVLLYGKYINFGMFLTITMILLVVSIALLLFQVGAPIAAELEKEIPMEESLKN